MYKSVIRLKIYDFCNIIYFIFGIFIKMPNIKHMVDSIKSFNVHNINNEYNRYYK